MAGIIAFLMTAFVTWMNLGFPPDYINRWLYAFVVAWPLAVVVAYIAIPISARVTGKILRAMGSDF